MVFMISSYLKYLLSSKNEYHLHSPFVYDFATNVLYDKTDFAQYEILSQLRAHVLNSHDLIMTTDFGAAAREHESVSYKKDAGVMAKGRSHTDKQNQFLFRLVHYYQPTTILELGTAFGLGTAALALGNPKARVCSLEGCPNLSAYARKQLESIEIKNVEIVTGRFETVLEPVLNRLKQIDLAFFDGNHRKDPTWNYFLKALPFKSESTVFVFDDIHWSKEMETVWEMIRQHESVSFTIDLYQFGIVFFKSGFEKQHFVLKM
jgi:Predicted O-methyltransferase